MASKHLINEDVLHSYAQMISKKFGVKVHVEGNTFKASEKDIYIPHMDNIPEGTLQIIIGGLIHECGHIRFTNYKARKNLKTRTELFIDNALEDIFIEKKLERKFAGARNFLKAVYDNYDAQKYNTLEDFWKQKGVDAEIIKATPQYFKNLYSFTSQYIFYKRGFSTKEPENKEWFKVFEAEMKLPAKSSFDNAARAERIVKKLKLNEAEHADNDRNTQQISEIEKTVKELREKIRELKEKPEYQESSVELKELTDQLKIYEEALDILSQDIKEKNDEVLEKYNKLDQLQKEFYKGDVVKDNEHTQVGTKAGNSKGPSLNEDEKSESEEQPLLPSPLSGQAAYEGVDFVIDGQDENKDVSSTSTGDSLVNADEKHEKLSSGNVYGKAEDFDYKFEKELQKDEVVDKQLRDQIDLLNDDINRKQDELSETKHLRGKIIGNKVVMRQEVASDKKELNKEIYPIRNRLNKQISEYKALLKAQAQLDDKYDKSAQDILKEPIAKLYGEFRSEPNTEKIIGYKESDPDWERIIVRGNKFSKTEYNPYSRERDKTLSFNPNKKTQFEYQKTLKAVYPVIAQTVDWLMKLQAPKKARTRFELERGGINSKDIWKVAAGTSSYIFSETTHKLMPNAAVTILVDFSGSMKPIIEHAKQAVVALNASLKAINIAHEILGYSTSTEEAYSGVDPSQFSRWVPVRNYVFKSFDQSDASTIFTDNGSLKMHDGVDGESLLWASDRLARRPERTKLIIYLTDSQPSCSRPEDVSAPIFGVEAEIRKQFYMVCKQVEKSDMHLYGVGICTNSTNDFFENSIRLDKVSQLPECICKIIRDVLAKTGLY